MCGCMVVCESPLVLLRMRSISAYMHALCVYVYMYYVIVCVLVCVYVLCDSIYACMCGRVVACELMCDGV